MTPAKTVVQSSTIQSGLGHELRLQFPLLMQKTSKPVIYLDTAASAQKPASVLATMDAWYKTNYANIHRGVYDLSATSTALYEDARRVVAAFLDAPGSVYDVVFTKGTTDGINLLAHSLPAMFGKRTEIVLTQLEHHANIVPWQQAAARHGCKIRYIPILRDGTLDMSAARKLITLKTALVGCVHVSNALGTINPVEELLGLARKVGAFTIIDAAQSVAHLPLSVRELQSDFLVFSGHKLYGPTGVGALVGRHDILSQLAPYQTGGDMIREVTWGESTFADSPHRFEAGTPNIVGVIGLAAAITWLQGIGMSRVRAHDQDLLTYGHAVLSKITGVHIEGPGPSKTVGAISFSVAGMHPHDVATVLAERGICIRGGHHCAMPLMKELGLPGTCRASFGVYSTTQDIDALAVGIRHAQEIFGVVAARIERSRR